MYFMFRLNAGFGLIILCDFPFLVGVIGLCLWRANPLLSRLQAHLDAINEIMQEDVSGIRIMKACVREAYEKTRLGKANGELVRTQLKTLVIFAFMNPLTNAIMYLAVTVILLAGSFSVGNGSATPGNVMAALTYTTQLLNGILMLVMLFQNISRGLASWKRVKEVLESVPELKEGSFDGAARAQGEIEFRDVSFTYPKSTRSVLSHINLKVHRGETVVTGIGPFVFCLITKCFEIRFLFYTLSLWLPLLNCCDLYLLISFRYIFSDDIDTSLNTDRTVNAKFILMWIAPFFPGDILVIS